MVSRLKEREKQIDRIISFLKKMPKHSETVSFQGVNFQTGPFLSQNNTSKINHLKLACFQCFVASLQGVNFQTGPFLSQNSTSKINHLKLACFQCFVVSFQAVNFQIVQYISQK